MIVLKLTVGKITFKYVINKGDFPYKISLLGFTLDQMYLNQFGFNIIQIQIDTQRDPRPVKSDTC
ncbi:MAG: hypothetical protein EBU92_00760 [Betaproteobacteria bacterium]|nr:hypothetical protein [Betaproteobacteria bacterium]